MTRDRVLPESARDVAEFSALLRSLKRNSGFTLRQLEERAAEQGSVLPRSTVADMLRRDGLPRSELLAAFVRACGDGQHLAEWSSARERLVLDEVREPPAEDPAPRRRTPVVLGAVAVVVVLLVVAVALWPRTEPAGDVPTDRTSPEVLFLPSAGSWVRIRAAGAEELCLTEGRDRAGRYQSAVAALRPCAEPGGPRVFMQSAGEDVVTVKWEHPVEHVMGCLTVMTSGPAKDMVEPREDCVEGDGDQVFRVERVADQRYRLRTPSGDRCLGLNGNHVEAGAEALRQPCAVEVDQEFLVDLDARD
ncbi:RICIN domain-containing protein [Umezawaea endophytica]|uniref:XRE family transcriptional regulator n=1 Tax=Umezawaea endophytica TaxID=1654476 RepID=A0A9X3A1B0_9PSEU|nr:hypothetical protein [Umezawaea endophytica]MCS7479414.1 hypothetical protein [Umezawaea endophytica]